MMDDPRHRSPQLMGILNVNVDSFSDPRAGRAEGPAASGLVQEGLELWEAGASVVDVGAESASPATPVLDAATELDALLPVLEGLHRADVATSVDTYKPEVARGCVAAGTSIVNDYTGLQHPELAGICADGGARLVLTHNPPGAKNKVLDADRHDDVVADVYAWFEKMIAEVEVQGLPAERLLLDPGIDLAKTPAQSISLLQGLSQLVELGVPLLVAVSRKDFIGALTASRPGQRDPGTLAALAHLAGLPEVVVRIHDVAGAAQYLQVADALAGRIPVPRDLSLAPELRRQRA
jgi:dihydropteroate synthase